MVLYELSWWNLSPRSRTSLLTLQWLMPYWRVRLVTCRVDNGRHPDGRDAGSAATGKSCTVRGASVFELREGRFSRCSDYWDMLIYLKQLGHAG